jgi:hypothetical protein
LVAQLARIILFALFAGIKSALLLTTIRSIRLLLLAALLLAALFLAPVFLALHMLGVLRFASCHGFASIFRKTGGPCPDRAGRKSPHFNAPL